MPQPHLLVIEKNPATQAQLRVRLTQEGFGVVSVSTAEEGFQAISREPIDLILVAMNLPKAEGLLAYQRIRRHPATRQIPVILLTRKTLENYWEAMPYDTDGPTFIGHPRNLSTLVVKIRQLLQQQNYTATAE
ncbi:MAG: response regulator [Candidatus Omnitrophica bacterium]|nr:response regulator [Candidatus Omnitrophota bacterium]